MKVVLAILLAALVAVFLSLAMNAEEEKKSDQKKEEEEREVIVNYEILEQGTYSGKKDSMAQLISSQNDWEALWKQHVSVLVPQPPVPEIDFETHVLAVIFAGEKKSGGYGVVIKDVSVEVDDVIVKYRLTEPQPNSFNIQVITQPFVILKIEKPKGTVRLVKE
jgi:hypothetical protein